MVSAQAKVAIFIKGYLSSLVHQLLYNMVLRKLFPYFFLIRSGELK
jgi:hypothetical protein